MVAAVVPPVASQKLLAFMIRRSASEAAFVDEAIRRAFGDLDKPYAIRLRSNAAADDAALFAQEKQNLYVDDAREVKAWSQALLRLPPDMVPKPTLKLISGWTTDGLDQLASWSRSDDRGPLDWNSEPELFTLGLQVIYGAQYLLLLSEAGVRIPLADLGYGEGSSGSHCLWRREAKQVLADSVTEILMSVHSRLRHIPVTGSHSNKTY
ncbi:hypothetical protein LTR53_017158 [Teratosphaeriaceae sp. CCFEE 6253]|nr:hypothetical protein LTR53_017158 [Teratosphaeriaceae sp. CCFEE 6253]